MQIKKKTLTLTEKLTSEEEKFRSEVSNLCGAVTVTFRVVTLFVVTKCYSYSKIVLQLIVVPTDDYPINRLTDPNPRLKPLIHVTIILNGSSCR
jgi:hypothetical protein